MKLISGSILGIDFWNAGRIISEAVSAGIYRLHFDVADGAFVSGISFGDRIVRSIAPTAGVPSEVHLMTLNPERQIASFKGIEGLNFAYFHIEAAHDPQGTMKAIKDAGMKVGTAISPSTDLTALKGVLDKVEAVLVMLVEPGRGGQTLMPEMIKRVISLNDIRRKEGLGFIIAADGGIKAENARAVAEAGADVLVVGSGIFGQKDIRGSVKKLLAELGSIS